MKPKLSYLSALLMVIAMFGWPVAARAAGDCDSNAVVFCGISGAADLQHKLSHGDGRHSGTELVSIYRQQGIDPQALPQTVFGTVTRDGKVMVGGKVVATGAQSDGRVKLSGSTADGKLWRRPTSVSFKEATLPALVYMPNGRFQWAVILSCGNPVHAAAVPIPSPAPGPVQPIPQTGPPLTPLLAVTFISMAAAAWTASRMRLLLALHRQSKTL